MKVFLKFLMAFIAIGIIAGYIYWQKNKKGIVKDTIQNSIQSKLIAFILSIMTVRRLMK